MCGIAGFTRPGADASELVARMASALISRGPDAFGAHVDAAIALGHRRLAVVDLDGGAQPRVDPASGDALAFNGEIYGYRDLAKSLRSEGVELRDESDTEVLFQLLRRYGIAATLERIDGMFAFAYRDGRTGGLYLARDRFGEKPLYYAEHEGQLVFASEVRALRHHPAFARLSIDPLSAYRFLFFDYVPAGYTAFAAVRKVLPGHYLTVIPDRPAASTEYWRPRIGQGGAMRESDAIDRLDELVTSSVRERLIADVPVGLFLSGGIDSGILAAITARMRNDIAAYTVRMPDSSYDETAAASAVARHCGLRHEIIDLGTGELSSAFDAVGGQLDELLADSSLLPSYMLCRAARRSLTVAIGGDGADELFGGYTPFKLAHFSSVMASVPSAIGKGLRKVLDGLPAAQGYMNAGFVAEQMSKGFKRDPDRQLFYWMSSFAEDEQERLWKRDMLPISAASRLFEPLQPALAEARLHTDPIDRMTAMFLSSYLPDDILTKMDRASMYNSLEIRSPFLDRRLAEFALSLPPRSKAGPTGTKRLLRRLALRYLPRHIVERPKHGFALPLSSLLRGELRERVADCLLDPSNPVADWFERQAIETLLAKHSAGRDLRKKIWPLYILFRVAANARTAA